MNPVNATSIRFAKIEDVDSLARLVAQLGYPFTVEQTRERFTAILSRTDEESVIVTEVNNQVVGLVHVHIYRLLMDAPEVEIGGIVVDEEFRGQGIGEKLVQAAEKWADDHGYSSVYMHANTIRARAHKFYKQLGYEIVKNQYAFRIVLK